MREKREYEGPQDKPREWITQRLRGHGGKSTEVTEKKGKDAKV
jgi:hypothetical protein